MQFIKDRDLYKVARITGPCHNFLAIRLSEEECIPQITPLPIKRGDVEQLDGQHILAQILKGLDEVNRALGTTYHLSEVQYIPSDSESSSVYEFLIVELIKRIEANGTFVVV